MTRTLVATPDPDPGPAARIRAALRTPLRPFLKSVAATRQLCPPCRRDDHVMCHAWYDGCCCEGETRFIS